jgi:hypothetical protein
MEEVQRHIIGLVQKKVKFILDGLIEQVPEYNRQVEFSSIRNKFPNYETRS